jgi:hypothetical protein
LGICSWPGWREYREQLREFKAPKESRKKKEEGREQGARRRKRQRLKAEG